MFCLDRYYIDKSTNLLISEDDIKNMEIGSYHEYVRGWDKNHVYELWIGKTEGCDDFTYNKLVFSWDISLSLSDLSLINELRESYFLFHKFKPLFLDKYDVPPQWFDEAMEIK